MTLALLAPLFLLPCSMPQAAPARTSASFPPEKILAALDANPGATVCEIGAGEGDTSIAIARLLGPSSRVFTSELGDSRLARLRSQVAASGLPNITVLSGDPSKTNFPAAACDAVFLQNVYHHFSQPASINSSIAAALKPGGRVAVIDFKPPAKESAPPAERARNGTHGVYPDTVARELQAAGLEPVSSHEEAPRWFLVVLSKPTR